MRIFISGAKYALLTAGLTDDERQEFDQTVFVYPDPWPDQIVVDQDRLAARFAELLARETRPALPWPWREVGYGWWLAPADTPPPAPNDWSRQWIDPDVLLNNVTPKDFYERWEARRARTGREAAPDPEYPAHRIEAGQYAAAALLTALPVARTNAHRRGWSKHLGGAVAALAKLTGIRIILDTEMPPDVWRLVDRTSRDVLYQGHLGTAADHERVIREANAQMAELLDIPLHLLCPDLTTEPAADEPGSPCSGQPPA